METVIDESYCFRKPVSHLSGSFASFWQAYLKIKTGFKWFFPHNRFFFFLIILESQEECFLTFAVWYSVQAVMPMSVNSKKRAVGHSAESRIASSHTEKASPH